MSNTSPVSLTDILPSDVLLGRGKLVHHHTGNVVYRNEVKSRSSDFQSQSSLGRDAIARDILENVHRRGGRFLRPVVAGDASQWETCPIRLALTKVKQALRDVNRQDPITAARTGSSSNDDVAAGVDGGTEDGEPERTSKKSSFAEGVARLPDPEESQITSGLAGMAGPTEPNDIRSSKLDPYIQQDSEGLGHSAPDRPVVHPPRFQEASLLPQYHQPNPTIESLHQSMQLGRSGLADYMMPRSYQGSIAGATSLVPQDVRLSSLYQQLAMPRNPNDSSLQSRVYATSINGLNFASRPPPPTVSSHPSPPQRPGDPPLDDEMSELLRRLRDGA